MNPALMQNPDFEELVTAQNGASLENLEIIKRVAGADVSANIWFLIYLCSYATRTQSEQVENQQKVI